MIHIFFCLIGIGFADMASKNGQRFRISSSFKAEGSDFAGKCHTWLLILSKLFASWHSGDHYLFYWPVELCPIIMIKWLWLISMIHLLLMPAFEVVIFFCRCTLFCAFSFQSDHNLRFSNTGWMHKLESW